MQLTKILPRVFLHTEKGQEIPLADPNPEWSVETVLNFYSGTYPVLATAKVGEMVIRNEQLTYAFTSTIGTKG